MHRAARNAACQQGQCPVSVSGSEDAYAFSPYKSIFVRRLVSARIVTGLNVLVFFGRDLRTMVVWPWTFLDLKREHPSFSTWFLFFSVSLSNVPSFLGYGEMNYVSALGYRPD